MPVVSRDNGSDCVKRSTRKSIGNFLERLEPGMWVTRNPCLIAPEYVHIVVYLEHNTDACDKFSE